VRTRIAAKQMRPPRRKIASQTKLPALKQPVPEVAAVAEVVVGFVGAANELPLRVLETPVLQEKLSPPMGPTPLLAWLQRTVAVHKPKAP